jgi:serine phosphatase RsbU (regulator of sigma subunit)/anti-sigma regulatory factor (Ser/Thr protein kinase)
MHGGDSQATAPHSGGKDMTSDPEELRSRIRDLSGQLLRAQGQIQALEAKLRNLPGGARSLSEEQRELRLLAEQFERQAMLLERDEHVARELQKNLCPVVEDEFEGMTIALETRPGTRVGGDFYDVIALGDKFVAFLIADVSGYGLPAAVIMATGRLAFRTCTATALNPLTIMDNANRTLLRSTLAGHYLTAFLGVLDTELLTLQYVNASHCSPFVLRDGEAMPLDTEGLFVGMFEDAQYEQKGVQLERNDRLIFYTDGLLRGFDVGDRQASQVCLQENLRQNSGLSLHEMISQLSNLLAEPEDDVALMGVELHQEKCRQKVISISSIPSQLSYVESAILPVLANKGYGERALFGVKLALEEAAINAIKHGNQLDDTKKVTVSFTIDEDCAAIAVADEGEGFDPGSIPDPTDIENLTATSGRGLALINAYMDEVTINEKGNQITMVKYAPWATAKQT